MQTSDVYKQKNTGGSNWNLRRGKRVHKAYLSLHIMFWQVEQMVWEEKTRLSERTFWKRNDDRILFLFRISLRLSEISPIFKAGAHRQPQSGYRDPSVARCISSRFLSWKEKRKAQPFPLHGRSANFFALPCLAMEKGLMTNSIYPCRFDSKNT
ncbi:MAG: hypothetical protein QMD77_04740 [Patescibacteria group bacterium]|nr:hypothetical protein [Patescibacteria group bacterium]